MQIEEELTCAKKCWETRRGQSRFHSEGRWPASSL
jgi:hypothetical protein